MHQAVTTHSKPAKFDELAFYDTVTGAVRDALGILHCATDSASMAHETMIADAVNVSIRKLEDIQDSMKEWESDRDARAHAEQVKVDAAKLICGVGEPVPLTRETRKRLQELLDQSVELKVAKPRRRRTAKGGAK